MSNHLRDAVFAAEDIETEDIVVPEWGDIKLQVRGLTAKARAELTEACTDESSERLNLTVFWPMLVIQTIFDPETGAQVFDEGDMAALAQKAAKPIENIANVASRLSGFDKAALDAAGNDSSTSQEGGSSTN